jgi:cytochrome c peroxidase
MKAWALLLAGLAAVEVAHAAPDCPGHLQFLGNECAQWQSYVLPEAIPAARGNAFADSDAAAALGMKVFYDNRFSRSGSGVACVSCHDPESAFTERKATSNTIREGPRNAPDLINAVWYTRLHFWDGKVDNLWSAPLFTFEQPDEMGSSRLAVVHTLASIYKIRYENIFGPMPDLGDTRRFPAAGRPGEPPFDAMSEQDRVAVNRVYVNLGKSLEAYIRKLAAGRAPFDDFVRGYPQAISVDAQHGMSAFARHGCNVCHIGPTFTDESFHDLRSPRQQRQQDSARAGGIAFASEWPFTSMGRFADPVAADLTIPAVASAGDPRGFRTPTLRNVALTYPYGHDGAFDTLEQVIDGHAAILPGKAPPDVQDKRDIVAFLRTLSGSPPRPPWNYWPGGR